MSSEENVFKALASQVRREILFHLRQGELSAGEIAGNFDIAAPTISRHLGVLKSADLVRERRDGNRILYAAAQEEIAATLTDFLGAVCPTQKVQRRRGSGRQRR